MRNLVLLKILNSHFYSLSSLIIAKKIEFLFPQNSFLAIFSLYRAKFGQMSLDGKKKFFCFIFSPFFSLNTPVKKVSFMNKIKIWENFDIKMRPVVSNQINSCHLWANWKEYWNPRLFIAYFGVVLLENMIELLCLCV